MLEQHHPTGTDDDRRTRDVDRVGFTVERVGEPVELGERSLDARPLGIVDRVTLGERTSDLVTEGF